MKSRLLRLLALGLLASCWCPTIQAQQPQSHQLMLVNENDNYNLTYTDRYYSNGLMLRYTQALPQKKGRQHIITAELGQQIFTPYTFSLEYRKAMDRPFTGFLYTKVLHTRVNKKGQLLQYGAMAGVVGEQAFGKEVQRWHHRTWRLKYPYGWEKQLRTGVGVNLEGRFVQPLAAVGSPHFGLKLNGYSQAQVGNLFLQAATGALIRLGALQDNAATAAYNTRVSRTAQVQHPEWYFFYEPQINAQWHNATLQGVLGQKADHYYTTTPTPWVCQQKVGFVYAPHRWTAELAFSHRSKEAVTQRANENWGTVALGYRW